MRIIFCVTNDIVTDQRVNRIAHTLLKLSSEICIAGIKRKKSLPLQNNDIRSIRFRMVFLKGPMFYLEYNIRLFFFLLFTRSDILVADDLDTLPAVYFASVLKKRPIVYDSHEYFTELPELVDRESVRRIWLWIEKRILPGIKYSYTVSESIAAGYNNKYGTSMQVIRNLPHKLFLPPTDSSLKKDNEKTIIYQGALNMGRGLDLAILAMQFLNHCRLVIAGGGYLEDELKKLVKSHDLSAKVQFLGVLRPDELVKHTAQADLGISLEEGKGLNYYYALPNKLFDYIQARIPVLVSELPEMASVVRKYNVGRVILTNDPHELADAFQEMLFSDAMREKWKHSLDRAAAELCWENEEIKLLGIYRNVVKDHAFLAANR